MGTTPVYAYVVAWEKSLWLENFGNGKRVALKMLWLYNYKNWFWSDEREQVQCYGVYNMFSQVCMQHERVNMHDITKSKEFLRPLIDNIQS